MSNQVMRNIMRNAGCLEGMAYYYMDFYSYQVPGKNTWQLWLVRYLGETHRHAVSQP